MSVTLFTTADRARADAVSELVYTNPFSPERIACERRALGPAFVDAGPVWSLSAAGDEGTPNIAPIRALAERLTADAGRRLAAGRGRVTPGDATLYADLCTYVLYSRHNDAIRDALLGVRDAPSLGVTFAAIRDERDALLAPIAGRDLGGVEPVPGPAHLFACFHQIVRAFAAIVSTIVGTTPPAARLRGQIWQSIFTYDLRRYRRSLFDKTADFTTLVTGESGTGKELVARAIGASRYVPFDAARGAFAQAIEGSFVAVSLAALSPTLVESELFGHRRGAFTGAVADRKGWLQTCPPLGTIFLDEIGELDASVQVKLLRVLQARTFERLGDTRPLAFTGKIIAATNRTLAREIREGRFRQDLFYRLCADVIETPPLRELLAGSDDELRRLAGFVARRIVPDDAERLTDEVMANAKRHLGRDYAWPGNFRELEQCVRNVLIRGEYRPPREPATGDDWLDAIRAGTLDADALLSRYATHVYRKTGTYERAAAQLKRDRRTVRDLVKRTTDEGPG